MVKRSLREGNTCILPRGKQAFFSVKRTAMTRPFDSFYFSLGNSCLPEMYASIEDGKSLYEFFRFMKLFFKERYLLFIKVNGIIFNIIKILQNI